MSDRRQGPRTSSREARTTPSTDSAMFHGLKLTCTELSRANARLERENETLRNHLAVAAVALEFVLDREDIPIVVHTVAVAALENLPVPPWAAI